MRPLLVTRLDASRRALLIGALLALFLIGIPSIALAYNEADLSAPSSISEENCGGSCHDPYFTVGNGPHGGFRTTSRLCRGCHTVHKASAAGRMLLPAATITASCNVCHDGTGGGGVYGSIAKRGVPVQSAHRTEVTSTIPGGNALTGGSATLAFSGLGGTLTCTDCHSPHGSQIVTGFPGDRIRYIGWSTPPPLPKLLKKRPTGATADVDEYGSDWCLACHKGRDSGGPTHNHPVDSRSTHANPFVYRNVSLVASETTTPLTVMGAMGGVKGANPPGNRGFLMVYPRTAQQSGHAPICMQCHEDSRSVGVLTEDGASADPATATITTSDGQTATDNPRFQNFPHEAVNPRFLVETADDLCTNCHPPARLP